MEVVEVKPDAFPPYKYSCAVTLVSAARGRALPEGWALAREGERQSQAGGERALG